ncbi:hypothetical protein HHI36_005852 [Cryptolaemus montrouzieri]|uniref:BEN domain-containing protein n=1 Tax=Cryptolaemus montrouzieri TaxID=559131 RepID=A0ABD2NVV1_9CUCU
MMSAMEIDKVLSMHNYAKKESFDTIDHVDKPPEKVVNTYQESEMMFQGELEKGKISTLLTPSESMCGVLDIKGNKSTDTSDDFMWYNHKLKKAVMALRLTADDKANSASNNSVPIPSVTPRESIKSGHNEVLLGAGGTTVPRREYEKLDFQRMKYTIAVRRLLNLKFTKEELATHSQTGKESPAFIGVKARKPQLDPVRVGDIRLHVAKKYNIDTSLVNKAITVALADARKTKKRKIEKEDTD